MSQMTIRRPFGELDLGVDEDPVRSETTMDPTTALRFDRWRIQLHFGTNATHHKAGDNDVLLKPVRPPAPCVCDCYAVVFGSIALRIVRSNPSDRSTGMASRSIVVPDFSRLRSHAIVLVINSFRRLSGCTPMPIEVSALFTTVALCQYASTASSNSDDCKNGA